MQEQLMMEAKRVLRMLADDQECSLDGGACDRQDYSA